MAQKYPWWRWFNTRKNSDVEDSTFQHESDHEPKTVEKTSGKQTDSRASDNFTSISDETYDDSNLDPMFNENICRRNWRISRSGRFKEKRVRATLPQNNNLQKTGVAMVK